MSRFDIYLMRIREGDFDAAVEAANDSCISKAQSYELYCEARMIARRYC